VATRPVPLGTWPSGILNGLGFRLMHHFLGLGLEAQVLALDCVCVTPAVQSTTSLFLPFIMKYNTLKFDRSNSLL